MPREIAVTLWIRRFGLLLSAAIAPAALAAEQTASVAPMSTLDAMAAVAERGYRELHEIAPVDGRYRVTVRDGAGRLREMEMDPATGELDLADTGGLYSNSIDPYLFLRLRGSLAPSLPQGAKPAHELAAGLLRSGDYAEVQAMSLQDDAYRVTALDKEGKTVKLRLDPITGKVD